MARKRKRALKSTRRPSQSRSQETVEIILRACAQILEREGYIGCTTNHIAERAGVSIGTLYQYFEDKEAILKMLFEREIQKDSDAIQLALAQSKSQPIEGVISHLIEVTLARLSEHTRLRQVLFQELKSSGEFKTLNDIKRHLSAILGDYLRSHAEFRVPKDIQFGLLIVVHAVEAALYAAIWEFGSRLDRPRLVAEVSDLVLGYLSRYRAKYRQS